MITLKRAALTAIFAPLFVGALISSSAAQDASSATNVKATVLSADLSKELDFTCAVESQGVSLGTFMTPNALVIPKRLPDIVVTCSKAGYEPVKFAMKGSGLVPATVAPRFSAKAVS